MQRKIGIMGGTFDPIHNGHLVAASEVADRFALDEVLFVPTGQPWQKVERAVSRAEDRYLMTVVATASNPRFSVSRVDIDRGGPTYTVDTLSELHDALPDAELFFITGADALSPDPVVARRRAGVPLRPLHRCDPPRLRAGRRPPARRRGDAGARCRRWRSRRRTAARGSREGRPVWYLVPDGVVQYISKRHLYRDEKP